MLYSLWIYNPTFSIKIFIDVFVQQSFNKSTIVPFIDLRVRSKLKKNKTSYYLTSTVASYKLYFVNEYGCIFSKW